MFPAPFLHQLREFASIQTRHDHVRDHQINPLFAAFEDFETFLAVARFQNFVTKRCEGLSQELAQGRAVFDYQNCSLPRGHSADGSEGLDTSTSVTRGR